MGEVIAVHNEYEWDTKMAEADSSKKLVVTYFSATWSEECGLFSHVFHDLAKKLTNVTFLEADVDESKSLFDMFNVSVMPTFTLHKEGDVVEKISRASKGELGNKIEKHMIA